MEQEETDEHLPTKLLPTHSRRVPVGGCMYSHLHFTIQASEPACHSPTAPDNSCVCVRMCDYRLHILVLIQHTKIKASTRTKRVQRREYVQSIKLTVI